MNTVTLKIEGMHCGGCASKVQFLLERQAGIKKAVISHENKEARVLYDPQTITEEQLVLNLERGGYQVTDRLQS
jgi:copper chaperone